MEQLTQIYQKSEIIEGLKQSFQDVEQFVTRLNEHDFTFKPGVKWSVAENLDHLIRSTKGLASALKKPKITLRVFGTPNRLSKDFLSLVSKYHSKLQGGGVASGPYVPEKNAQFSQNEMLTNWMMIGGKFSERLGTWSESQLDDYLLPHPLLGKLTIREMMFFTIYHNNHHLRAMQLLHSE